MGRLINLPDDVILHMVSFFPAKEAARLQCASKKWLNLIYIIPSLEFDEPMPMMVSGVFEHFVAGLLARHADHRVRRFSLKLPDVGVSRFNHVNECLRDVLKRGVLDLELGVNVNEGYSLPFEVFTCKSVVTLKLGSGFVIGVIPQDALLPALETLILDSVRFDGLQDAGCVFQRLLSACPVLEELVIHGHSNDHWNWSRTVSSQILKRLTIRRIQAYSDDADSETISFDTPSLEYFEYCDALRDEYPVVNFNSLLEANLVLPQNVEGPARDLTNLFKGLKNVRILRFGAVDTMSLIDSFRAAVPWFENLFLLEVTIEPDSCWGAVEILLESSPNIKTFIIEGTLHYVDHAFLDKESVCDCLLGYSFLMSCPIETLKITMFIGDTGEMVQMKHILQKLPCLELLELHAQARTDGKKLQIMSDLLMLPRESSKCKVQERLVAEKDLKSDACIVCQVSDMCVSHCSGNGCLLRFHEECLTPEFGGCEDLVNPFCPYCWFKIIALKSKSARDEAIGAEKAVCKYLDKETKIRDEGKEGKVIADKVEAAEDEERVTAENFQDAEDDDETATIRTKVQQEIDQVQQNEKQRRRIRRIELNATAREISSNKERHGGYVTEHITSATSGKMENQKRKLNAATKVAAYSKTARLFLFSSFTGTWSILVVASLISTLKKLLAGTFRFFNKDQRSKLFWTSEEEEMLKVGVEKFAAEINKNMAWRKILEMGEKGFSRNTYARVMSRTNGGT